MTKYILRYTVPTTLFLYACTIFGAGLGDISEAFRKGDIEGAIERGSEAAFDDSNKEDFAKIYSMLAIAYTLKDTEDSRDSIATLKEFLGDMNTPGKDEADKIMGFLSGSINENDFKSALKNFPGEWSATGHLSRYLAAVRNEDDAGQLNEIRDQYYSQITGMSKNHWATSWYERVGKWHSWMLLGKGDVTELEPLVSSRSADRDEPENREKLYAEVAKIIDMRLSKKKNPALKAAEKILSEHGDDPVVAAVLSELTGKKDYSMNELFETAKTDPALWAMGCIGLFISQVEHGRISETETLIHYLDTYLQNLRYCESKSAKTWKTRIPAWKEWSSGFGTESGLEPLLADISAEVKAKGGNIAAISYPDISKISLEDYIETRKIYENRPRPQGVEFSDASIADYLNSLPEEKREGEKRRLQLISEIRMYLVRIMERNPYDKGIILRDGRKVRGALMANANVLSVKKGSRRFKRYKWSELPLEQYIAFFEHYANMRIRTSVPNQSDEERMKHAADDYLHLALLCDWYKDYENAIRYARMAIDVYPACDSNTDILFFK